MAEHDGSENSSMGAAPAAAHLEEIAEGFVNDSMS